MPRPPRVASAAPAIDALCEELKDWLLGHACELWLARGMDRVRGGFHESLALDGEPTAEPRRARVQPRQIYAFTAAHELGWRGPVREVVEHGLRYFLTHFRRSDGFYRSVVAADGTPLEDAAVLYDQAFALFGFAAASQALGGREDVVAHAADLRDRLCAELAHPRGGFEESVPRSLPLQSNSHMHLFEAALAWLDAGGDEGWRAIAEQIADLALTRFADERTGAIREFFDGDWNAAPGLQGRRIEPGHLFEWGWLLVRWGRRTGRDVTVEAALRLIDLAETHGVDPARGAVMNALLDDFSVQDRDARLWCQTERLKAACVAAEVTGERRFRKIAAESARTLMKYLDVPVRGLWRDRMRPDGSFAEGPAPASSFYHIVGAIAQLERTAKAI